MALICELGSKVFSIIKYRPCLFANKYQLFNLLRHFIVSHFLLNHLWLLHVETSQMIHVEDHLIGFPTLGTLFLHVLTQIMVL